MNLKSKTCHVWTDVHTYRITFCKYKIYITPLTKREMKANSHLVIACLWNSILRLL